MLLFYIYYKEMGGSNIMNTEIVLWIIILVFILAFIGYVAYCCKTKKGAQLQKVK